MICCADLVLRQIPPIRSMMPVRRHVKDFVVFVFEIVPILRMWVGIVWHTITRRRGIQVIRATLFAQPVVLNGFPFFLYFFFACHRDQNERLFLFTVELDVRYSIIARARSDKRSSLSSEMTYSA